MKKAVKKAPRAKRQKIILGKPVKSKHLVWNPTRDPDADPALPALETLTSGLAGKLRVLAEKQQVARPTWHYRFAESLNLREPNTQQELLLEALPHVPVNAKIREQLGVCSAEAILLWNRHIKGWTPSEFHS